MVRVSGQKGDDGDRANTMAFANDPKLRTPPHANFVREESGIITDRRSRRSIHISLIRKSVTESALTANTMSTNFWLNVSTRKSGGTTSQRFNTWEPAVNVPASLCTQAFFFLKKNTG